MYVGCYSAMFFMLLLLYEPESTWVGLGCTDRRFLFPPFPSLMISGYFDFGLSKLFYQAHFWCHVISLDSQLFSSLEAFILGRSVYECKININYSMIRFGAQLHAKSSANVLPEITWSKYFLTPIFPSYVSFTLLSFYWFIQRFHLYLFIS